MKTDYIKARRFPTAWLLFLYLVHYDIFVTKIIAEICSCNNIQAMAKVLCQVSA